MKMRFSRALNLRARHIAVLAGVACSVSTASAQYHQTNLVSDGGVPAVQHDPNLVNAWGLAFNPTGVWWVADNHSGLSTLYDGNGAINSLVVGVPGADGGAHTGSPTGIVFSGSNNFVVGGTAPARFIFAGEDGTISAWAPSVPPPPPSTQAQMMVNNSTSGAIYKGLALATSSGGERLYATDFHNGRIDVFDGTFAHVSAPGGFTDPNLPSGFAPFNIQKVGASLVVTYAQQDANGEDDVPGPGHGFVDIFDTDGNLQRRLVSQNQLNSPWGVAQAPADFGPLSNALLIGNFGDGLINAFDPTTGAFLGAVSDASGQPIDIDGLWALQFGNGAAAGPTNSLYFTAGPGGEEHGLFGSVTIPGPASAMVLGLGLLNRRRRRM